MLGFAKGRGLPIERGALVAKYRSRSDRSSLGRTRDGGSTTLLPLLWDGEVGGALNGTEPWCLDATTANVWNEARGLLEQMVSVPAYPWEQIERGARPPGEAAEWGRGSVQTSRGELRRLARSVEKGLWFRRG